jgi:hypothetical protein
MTDIKYAHTDSLYVGVDSPEHAMDIVDTLNEKVREHFPNVFNLKNHPVTLEFEKFYRTLGVGSVKNRNAGMISWMDGKYLEEEKFVLTGFIAKRISETKLSKDVQLTVLKMWVNENTEAEISEYVREKYNEVLSGNIPIEDLIKRTRYREERFTAYCSNCKKNGWQNKKSLHNLSLAGNPCCNNPSFRTSENKRVSVKEGIEGVLFYNTLNPHNPIDDSYFFLKIIRCNSTYHHPIKQIATVPALSVLNKAEPIFTAMGWDLKQASKDRKQGELTEWF